MNFNKIQNRITSNIKYKLLVGSILTISIYSIYLIIQRYPVFPVKTMNLTFLDDLFPFVPSNVYLYQSIWLFIPIAPWLMESKNELYRYTFGLIFITCICFSFFYFYPTMMPRPQIHQNINNFYLFLIKIDKNLNAFPSLHVALSIFSGLFCHKLFSYEIINKKIRFIIWIWVIGIIISTLLTKQHMIYDIIGGLFVGIIGFILSDFRNIFFKGLLDSKEIFKNITVIKDLFVNFYIVTTEKGLICFDSGWNTYNIKNNFLNLELDYKNVIAIFLTHKHLDHSRCCHLFPNAKIYSKNNLKDGEIISFNDTFVKVIETPGHTDCSLSYLIDNKHLFTGDTIRIKNNKILPFYSFFNNNNKLIKSSIKKTFKY